MKLEYPDPEINEEPSYNLMSEHYKKQGRANSVKCHLNFSSTKNTT
jgi:hypothetical protein